MTVRVVGITASDYNIRDPTKRGRMHNKRTIAWTRICTIIIMAGRGHIDPKGRVRVAVEAVKGGSAVGA
jgi:hypothetical protein